MGLVMPREEAENERQAMREQRAEIEKAKMAAQDRRADAALRLHSRQTAVAAAANAIEAGASAKQIIDLAKELLVWIESE
jgi:F0F1-type ATP synthase membrane subunit b/b'